MTDESLLFGSNASWEIPDAAGGVRRTIKTKWTNPYDYDPIPQFHAGTKTPANGTIYTDHLLMWDFDKHDRLCEKHFGNRGQYWDRRAPQKIEAFLRDWCDDPKLKLIAVIEYCNVSNGYPTWRLDYATKAATATQRSAPAE